MNKIKLNNPIIIDGVEIKEIQIREPKVKDMIAISKGTGSDYEKEVRLIANLSEMAPEHISEISYKDYLEIQKVVRAFLLPDE